MYKYIGKVYLRGYLPIDKSLSLFLVVLIAFLNRNIELLL